MLNTIICFLVVFSFGGCSLQQILLDNDMDGVYNHKDICPNTPKNTRVDTFGCGLDSDLDGVIDSFDRCPNTSLQDSVDRDGCPL